MARDSFPTGVAERLKWYVYRLIDPRNGETFYVGKGKGNRIFAHAKADYTATISQGASALHEEDNEDASDLKMKRINEIRAAGLEVGHVVHQHGIEQEKVAYQVEAALIDAYPGLTNLVDGRGSSIRPIWHCQLVREPRQDATLGIDEGLWDVRWSWCTRSTESGWQHRKRDGSGR